MDKDRVKVRDHSNCANCGKKLKPENPSSYCDSYCEQGTSTTGRMTVNDDEWINGVWENIAWDPVVITGGRKQLIEECKKHGVMPKALLKPKSRGKGYEMRESRW